MKKIVGIATIPDRIVGLHDTLNSLSPQVDKIHVWLNNYTTVPHIDLPNVKFHLGDDIGDVGKIKILDYVDVEDFYFFTVDDDILYPSDYIQKNISYYQSGTIQSSHGKVYESLPITSFNHGDISGYYFGGEIKNRTKIHAIGTGVAMMDSKTARSIPYNEFVKYPNMLDTWISAWAYLNDVDMYIVPHNRAWLLPNQKINQSDSIWETTKFSRDGYLTQIFNHYVSLK